MVDACNYCAFVVGGAYRVCSLNCSGSIYLHIVLMELSAHKITQTLLVLALAFMAIHLWLVPQESLNSYFLYTSIFLTVLALFPTFVLSAFIAKGWLKFGEAMSWVMSKIILGLLFYLFVFPISSLYRLLNKDLLMLKKRNDSYYTERNHLFEKKDIENPW